MYEFKMQYGSIGCLSGPFLEYTMGNYNHVILRIGDGSFQVKFIG
jgi:TPP-dependent 2-oxoacid decarboxylase